MTPHENLFRSILGANSVRTATTDDAVLGVQPQLVLEPINEPQLASALRQANDSGLAVIPRGGATKLAWGNPPQRADVILSTARLNKILEHAASDLTVSVEAGCTIRELQAALAVYGQRLAIDVLRPKNATVGGILSTNDSGALRLRFGSLRDLIIGVTIALPDGTLASSGGKVVKNVAGYDLPKLITGAFGTLGVITRAVFRLHPLPQSARTFTCLTRDVAQAQSLLLAIQDSQLAHSALQVRFIQGSPQPQLDILFEGTEAGINAQAATQKSLVTPAPVVESDHAVWNARQELFNLAQLQESPCAVAKVSFLPAQLAALIEAVSRIATANQLRFSAVAQAFGLATLLLEGSPQNLHAALESLRTEREHNSASLFVAQRPANMPPLDTFGNFGDALPLMQSLKLQFDPKRTLNLSRFLPEI
jgi:glycolate oxidase FAD binding subunit